MKSVYGAVADFGNEVMYDEDIDFIEISIFKRNDRGQMERETHTLSNNHGAFRQRPFHHTIAYRPMTKIQTMDVPSIALSSK